MSRYSKQMPNKEKRQLVNLLCETINYGMSITSLNEIGEVIIAAAIKDAQEIRTKVKIFNEIFNGKEQR